jgi:hypothetical protein
VRLSKSSARMVAVSEFILLCSVPATERSVSFVSLRPFRHTAGERGLFPKTIWDLRCPLMRYTPSPMRCTPIRYAPGGCPPIYAYTDKVYAHVIYAHDMYAPPIRCTVYKLYAHKMYVYDVVPAYKVQMMCTHKVVNAYKVINIYEAYSHKAYIL